MVALVVNCLEAILVQTVEKQGSLKLSQVRQAACEGGPTAQVFYLVALELILSPRHNQCFKRATESKNQLLWLKMACGNISQTFILVPKFTKV